MAKRSRSSKTSAKSSASTALRPADPVSLENLVYAYDAKLPTLWVDNVRISLRVDGLGVLSFFQTIPGHEINRMEVARIITNVSHLKQISDVLRDVVTTHYSGTKGSEA